MRKLIRVVVIFIWLALALAAVSTAAGCGDSNQGKAQDLLQKADTFMNRLDKGVDTLASDLEALSETIKEGGALTASFLDQTSASLRNEASQVVEQVRQARLETAKVLALKASYDYKEYAALQDEILDNAVTLTKTLSDVFTQLSGVSAALSAGTTPDTTQLSDTASGWVDSFNEIKNKSRALLRKAEKLKEEKDL
jgi:septal ring factor EnvC (AmiA/AmiB activator)